MNKMEKIRNLLMSANKQEEVNDIVLDNLEFLLMNPQMFTLVSDTRKRIDIVEKTKKQYWKVYEMN
jgi:hypothetical protein